MTDEQEEFEDAYFEWWLQFNVDDGYARSMLFGYTDEAAEEYITREVQQAWIGWNLALRSQRPK